MRKYIVLAVLSIVLTLGLNAQEVGSYTFSSSDGFFNSHANEDIETREEQWGAMPRIFGHGLDTNQNAPLGSGLLLLAGMGLAYGMKKKIEN